VKDTVRTIYSASLSRAGDELTLLITGNGFLYNMVRIIAGTQISVGIGKLALGAFARALASGSRLDLGVTAPAHGLTLMEVYYDESRLLKGGFL
jgi:tRNA pseudouridine38-40 synthase